MGALEIVIIAACAILVSGTVIASVIKKKKGRTSCDYCGDCNRCGKYYENCIKNNKEKN